MHELRHLQTVRPGQQRVVRVWPHPEHPEGRGGNKVDGGGTVPYLLHPVYGRVLHGDCTAARGETTGKGQPRPRAQD